MMGSIHTYILINNNNNGKAQAGWGFFVFGWDGAMAYLQIRIWKCLKDKEA